MNELTSTSVTRLAPADLERRIERLLNFDGPRFRRLWGYYQNPMLPIWVDTGTNASHRPYRQAQEWGLPPRITGLPQSGLDELGSQPLDGVARKEVVIENDIAWRIDTQIDFLFGKRIAVHSTAADPARRETIERVLSTIFEQHGGITFLQQLALLGAVYGFVDVLVKLNRAAGASRATDRSGASSEPSADGAGPFRGPDRPPVGSPPPVAESAPGASSAAAAMPAACLQPTSDDLPAPGASTSSLDDAIARIARSVRLEIVEPARALPLLSPTDWRQVDAYLQVYRIPAEPTARRTGAKRSALRRFLDRLAANRRAARFFASASDDDILVTELLTACAWQRYEDETLVAHGSNSLGILPLVHIQNSAVPFQYAGGSDVEMLIPLQDELNTRLCDRAHRITMQSFKMYLGIGIENFNQLPVAPGRMWMSDNDQAKVLEFGGDSAAPSEDRHIQELREALDKASGVTPIAAGVVRGRIGQLTSAAALRVTLAALLARTARKRITYGEGIARICELALAWLDRAGIFPTRPEERQVRMHWPSPLPENDLERLEQARLKLQIGIPYETVLRELGY